MRLQLHKLSIIIIYQSINQLCVLFRIIKGGAVATQQMDVGNRIKQVCTKMKDN